MTPQNDYKSVLKQLSKERSHGEILELARAGRFIECAERAISADPSSFSEKERIEIGLALYAAGKVAQFDNKKRADSLKFFNRSKDYQEDQNRNFLIQNRTELMHKKKLNSLESNSKTVAQITLICKMKDPNKRPIEVIGALHPDFFEKAKAPLYIPGVESIHCIGIYRWRGDVNASTALSPLLRAFKLGEDSYVDFFQFLAREHLIERPKLLGEIDIVIPVPPEPARMSERKLDLAGALATISLECCIPLLKPLKRKSGSVRSKDCYYEGLRSQYTIDPRLSARAKGMIVLLVDDVITRGHTARVCAELLLKEGAKKVHVFCLARSESTIKSSHYFSLEN